MAYTLKDDAAAADDDDDEYLVNAIMKFFII
jgi:hypothetical protein